MNLSLRPYLLAAVIAGCSLASYGRSFEIKSPDGHLCVAVSLAENISFSVSADSRALLRDCPIGMTVDGQALGSNPVLKKAKADAVHQQYHPVVAIKNAVVNDFCNRLRLDFRKDFAVEFRVYDDGMAYRFITRMKKKIKVQDEELNLRPVDNDLVTMSPTSTFRSSYEESYEHVKIRDYKTTDRMNYPPLFMQTPDGYHLLLSEADLRDYPCLFLRSDGQGGLKAVFPPYPAETEQQYDRFMVVKREADYIAETDGDRTFPWRFLVISRDARVVAANQMAYKLAAPCELQDTGWIRPGKVSWDWWNGRGAWNVDFRAGCNEDTYKHFIDFAAKYGVPYIILDEGWAVNTSDPLHSNKDIDIHRLIDYGRQKGVKLILWLTWLEVERNFNLFAEYEKWGIAGVKIDFMDRSDQWMVNFYERVVKEAARHHILVDFHGSFKPAGLERRYPNLLSYEGVLGLEQGGRCRPENTNWLPFIRNAVGPMDFTPGGMTNVQPDDNHSTWAIPMASGTRAYQMALYVVFESGIQMLADCPERYELSPDCTRFMADTPVTWDETRVLAAEAGKYIVTARRKGGKWYLGAINDGTERELSVRLDFLSSGSHAFRSFCDGINADRQAMDYRRQDTSVDAATTFTFRMAKNGGMAGVIE